MRTYLACLALLAALAAYVVLHPPRDLAVGGGVLAACPVSLGAWNGSALSLSDAVLDELRADDVLVRRYQRDRDVAWLTVIYHQNRRYGPHDPRTCYESQGYLVEGLGRRRIDDGSPGGLTVNVFRASRPHDRRLVYYWWNAAGFVTPDAGDFRDRLALTGMIENRSWGAFVRVEALVREADEAHTVRELDDFTARSSRALSSVFAVAAGPGARR